MIHTLRVRIVTAALVALLLALAASPMLPDGVGFGGAAHADECTGSTC